MNATTVFGRVAQVAVVTALVGLTFGGAASVAAQGERPAPEPAVVAGETRLGAVAVVAAAPVAQVFPTGEPSIVVNGVGEASAAAETATIQFLIGSGGFDMGMAMIEAGGMTRTEVVGAPAVAADGTPEAGGPGEPSPAIAGPMGPPQLTEAQLEPVVQAIVDAGVDAEDVSVNVGPSVSGFAGPGGPGTGLVEVTLDQPAAEAVEEIVTAGSEAAADNGFFVQQLGVGYDVADCAPLEREAQQAAIADGREKAAQLAESLGVTLGDLIQASDYSNFGPPFAADDGGCPVSPEFGYYGPGSAFNTPPFDPEAPAEAEAYAQVNLVFAIAGGQS